MISDPYVRGTRAPQRSTVLGVALALGLAAAAPAEAAERVTWRMASFLGANVVQLGTLGVDVTKKIEEASDGKIQIRFYDPGALVPPLEIFDAVSVGSVDAGWGASGFWAGKEPALVLFNAAPFGPRAPEYLAWMYYGGGIELLDEIYAKHDVKSVPCGITAPEGGGWYKKRIQDPSDFQGLRMRFFGLGGKVVGKLGVSAQTLAGPDVYPALERGVIDALEYGAPAIDQFAGFWQIAKYYHFPGWQQQSTIYEIIVHKPKWDALETWQKRLIEIACGDNIRQGLAEGEALNAEAIRELQEKGVEIVIYPPEVIDALHDEWLEVVEEERAGDETFARVWDSYAAFREKYKAWGDIAYLR